MIRDLEKALDGRLALEARLRERARVYRRRPRSPEPPPQPSVTFDNELSDGRRPWSRCGRPTRSACSTASPGPSPSSTSTSARPRCRPSGQDVVDSFYVRDADGDKVTDPDYLAEIERAILGSLSTGRPVRR